MNNDRQYALINLGFLILLAIWPLLLLAAYLIGR